MVRGLLKQILETSPGILDGFVVFLAKTKDLVSNEHRAFWGKEFGQVEESKPRCVFCSSVGLTIEFWNPDGLEEECSYRFLGAGMVFCSMLTDDDASSSKRFLPAIAKDSFCC
ncbi:hypothetical protein Tco_0922040 [Tanacetum coccineum]|uniref:Uncharacterized protein n=1 Tax=Tanacetum coccineum TaxID=301880 RepID=A0ABQ5D0A9_9ASTR